MSISIITVVVVVVVRRAIFELLSNYPPLLKMLLIDFDLSYYLILLSKIH